MYLYIGVALIFYGCSNDVKKASKNDTSALFKRLSSHETGINFTNDLNEKFEYLDEFSYAYNGGGTAIGDVNNDGLQDVIFTSNEQGLKLYLNQGHLKFKDITQTSGLAYTGGWYNGISMVDINSDGFLDIYVCRGGWKDTDKERSNLLFLNQGDGSFLEKANAFGIGDIGYSTQGSFFDYDNDGDLDLYLVNRPDEFSLTLTEFLKRKENPNDKNRDKLFRNDDGKFIDVSKETGITNNFGYGLGVVTSDVNNDGYVDIYVTNDFDEYDYLYINHEGKKFVESVKTSTKHIPLYSMGVDIMDCNNDGLEDILVMEMMSKDHKRAKVSMPSMNVEQFDILLKRGFFYQYMHNMLQLNQGNNLFSEVGQISGLDKTDWSWTGLLSDLDNDGYKDVLVTNGYMRDYLDKDIELRTIEFFQKNKSKYRSAQELLADKEQEIIELYRPLKQRNYLFKNKGGFSFKDVSIQWGFSKESFSNGASVGDLDNDGDLDIVVNNLEEEAFVFENTTKNNGYLRVKFKGPSKNPLGLGAKVELRYNDKVQYQEFKMIRGYLSSQEPLLHFGLGSEANIDTLKVTWPGGKQQVLENLAVNQILSLNFSDAQQNTNIKPVEVALFQNQKDVGLDFQHKENEYNDYEKQVLLPHKYSQFGPGIAVGDINGDNRDDIYICGPSGQSGALYVQNENGTYNRIKGIWESNKKSEEISAAFFDANSDGKLDLYVVNGGNEFEPNDSMYKDKFYINKGNGKFKDASSKIPQNAFSGSKVRPADFDNDGDIDLFLGERLIPHNYPVPASGYLYENNEGVFKDITQNLAPELKDLGLITDALWLDYDKDNNLDLIVVGEWMPISIFKYNNGQFTKESLSSNGLENTEGWWYSIEAGDFDKDGDLDLVAGNLGLNYKYRATEDSPFEVFASDFDFNGRPDIILGFNDEGKKYPLRGKECSSQQMPYLKKKFLTYESFSTASIEDMVGKTSLENALHRSAKTFASIYLENNGDGTFKQIPLPSLAQLSSVNDIQVNDFDLDGHLDIVVGGNLYASEIETPRNDASFGAFLKGNGKGQFTPFHAHESGLYIDGDVKEMGIVNIQGRKVLVVAKNDDNLQVVKIGN
ncbi:VCBS repeat-containing protein [Flavobacteriaceae bacterium MHTCC 0001]